MKKGENASVMSAEAAVEKAEKALENAKSAEKEGIDSTLPEAIENAGNAVEKAEKAYNESVDEYEKALKELKPENHPSSVKKIYDELEEAKKLYDEVTIKPEVAELTNAEARYKSAYYEYINIDMYVAAYGEYNAEEIKSEYTAAKSALAEI